MRLSDLMACDVRTHDDRRVGRVRDVRVVMDGPAVTGHHAAMRVDALIVGGDALAGRLGYLRAGVRGPVPLSTILRRLERRATTINADEIDEWDVPARILRLRAAPSDVGGIVDR